LSPEIARLSLRTGRAERDLSPASAASRIGEQAGRFAGSVNGAAFSSRHDAVRLPGMKDSTNGEGAMTPDWTAISTRVTQIIEVLHHCQRRAAGEPADESGADQLIEFAANYGQSLDWIVLGDLDPTIRRLYAIGHDNDDPAAMVA
jgi:hypothetical protein